MYLMVFSVRGIMTCSLWLRVSTSSSIPNECRIKHIHGVDSPIHNLDNLIQDHKRSLQRRQLHQRLHSPRVSLPTLRHLLSTLAQTRHLEIAAALRLEALELRQEHTADVLLLGAHAELGLAHALGDLVANGVVADRVCDFGQREGGNLHHAAHLALRFVYALGDVAEALGEGFGFALQQVVAGLGAFELRFHEAEGLTGGEDGLAILGEVVLAGVGARQCMWLLRCTLPDMVGYSSWRKCRMG